jgi:hypothetical protein
MEESSQTSCTRQVLGHHFHPYFNNAPEVRLMCSARTKWHELYVSVSYYIIGPKL